MYQCVLHFKMDHHNESGTAQHFQEAMVLNPHLFFHGDDEYTIYAYAIPALTGFSLLANGIIIRTLSYRRQNLLNIY